MLTNASTEQILSVCPAPKNLPLQLIRTSFEDRLREGYRVEVLTCLKTLVSHKGGKLTGCWLTPSVPGRLPYNQKFGFVVVGRMWNSDVVCKGKSYNSTERQWQVAWGVCKYGKLHAVAILHCHFSSSGNLDKDCVMAEGAGSWVDKRCEVGLSEKWSTLLIVT